MIEVMDLPTQMGHKVHIALEELALPYNVVPDQHRECDQFTPNSIALTPNHRLPAIVSWTVPGGVKPLKLFEFRPPSYLPVEKEKAPA